VTELAAIRLTHAELAGDQFKRAEAAAQYERALAAAGFDVLQLSPAAVAQRIKDSPIGSELLAALDDWAVCAQSRAELERIYDVARSADPDPRWRDKVRDVSIIDDKRALSDLAAAAPIAEQSVPILLALGRRIDRAKGNPVPFCRRVQFQYPSDFWANFLLANVLQERSNQESIDYYLAARALQPDALVVYVNLSATLGFHGRSTEALEYAQRAVLIDPRSTMAHSTLGVCQLQLGRYEQAIASCRDALAVDPKYYYAVGVMCEALIDDGRLSEAKAAVEACLKGMPAKDPERPAMQNLASRIKELFDCEGRLDDVLAGKQQVTPRRRRLCATVCLVKRRYLEAVRLFDEAFALEPPQDDDVFAAACAASRAAEQAAGDMPAAERTGLRNKAIAWMRADVAAWSKVLDSSGKEADRVRLLRSVYPWRREPNLAPIRDADAIRALPPEQQAQCRALWRDVTALLMRAEAAAPP
jgi:tetratricopeptide (TPR) repeat protein